MVDIKSLGRDSVGEICSINALQNARTTPMGLLYHSHDTNRAFDTATSHHETVVGLKYVGLLHLSHSCSQSRLVIPHLVICATERTALVKGSGT
jgi:hypothetical protein